MTELFGQAGDLGWVVVKAVLMFALTVAGFRLGERRTFAQLSPFDFAVAVALGAIIGRTVTSSTTSFLTGAVALVTLLAAHWVITRLRRHAALDGIVDQPPNVLIANGVVQQPGLSRAGLTESDVRALLRQNEIGDLAEIDYLLYETRGGVSLHRAGTPPGPLMREALAAAGYATDNGGGNH